GGRAGQGSSSLGGGAGRCAGERACVGVAAGVGGQGNGWGGERVRWDRGGRGGEAGEAGVRRGAWWKAKMKGGERGGGRRGVGDEVGEWRKRKRGERERKMTRRSVEGWGRAGGKRGKGGGGWQGRK
ncbi:hypothetical protein DM083_30420, partial [Klebsiella pneumoniae]